MGVDRELERIERQLRRSEHLRRKAEEDLENYQRRREVQEVHRLPRHQRKRWMLRRMRDLGLVTMLLTFLRKVRSNPGETAATSAMAAMVGILVMGPSETPGDGPRRSATPPTAAAPPSSSPEVVSEHQDVQVEIIESEPTSGPTVQPDEATADPVSASDPESEDMAEPELSGSVDPTEAPEPEPSPTDEEPLPSPTPAPTMPPGESERDRRKICLELDLRPVVDLGVCVRELLGLSGDTQP